MCDYSNIKCLRVFGVVALLVVVLIFAAIITAFAGVSLTSCLASGILSILSTWLLMLTLLFSILCWCGCSDDSNNDDWWRCGIVVPVVSAAVIFSLCVIANSIVVFTGTDSCGEKQYAAYVQVGVSYVLIVAFAAFLVLFINALRDND